MSLTCRPFLHQALQLIIISIVVEALQLSEYLHVIDQNFQFLDQGPIIQGPFGVDPTCRLILIKTYGVNKGLALNRL